MKMFERYEDLKSFKTPMFPKKGETRVHKRKLKRLKVIQMCQEPGFKL